MYSYRGQQNQLVVSRQRGPGPVWPEAGNSFWISKLSGDWYICTWGCYYYQIPAECSVVDVCEKFVAVGRDAQVRVPLDIIERFSLVETDPDDFDRMFESARSQD
jgi:hypothetical protein